MRILLTLFSIIVFNKAFAQNVNPNFIDGELYIKFNENNFQEITDEIATIDLNSIPIPRNIQNKYQIRELENSFYFLENKSSTLNFIFRLKFDRINEIEELLNELDQLDAIQLVEKIPAYRTACTPNDPNYSAQFSLELINAEQAWCIPNQDTSEVIIGVVDGVFNADHEDLSENILGTWDLWGNDNNVGTDFVNFSGDDHGTSVASICSAVTNNNIGISSLGNNLKFIAIKAGSDDPFTIISRGPEGVLKAAQEGADIINLSFGGPSSNFTMQMAINEAVDSFGCIIVASAGNSNSNELHYPAAFDNVISVAASDSEDNKWEEFSTYGSNFGDWVDVTAPGANVLACKKSNQYASISGTSFSSPMVAALLGLVLKANPSLTRDEVINCVLSTTIPLNWTGGGTGRIDAFAAVNCAINSSTASINLPNLLEEINIYPNPTSDVISIEDVPDLNITEILIYDINGKLVRKHKDFSKSWIDISNLPSGMFFMKINDDRNRSKTMKFIKVE